MKETLVGKRKCHTGLQSKASNCRLYSTTPKIKTRQIISTWDFIKDYHSFRKIIKLEGVRTQRCNFIYKESLDNTPSKNNFLYDLFALLEYYCVYSQRPLFYALDKHFPVKNRHWINIAIMYINECQFNTDSTTNCLLVSSMSNTTSCRIRPLIKCPSEFLTDAKKNAKASVWCV